MIQTIIIRMESNSFIIRQLSIGIITSIFALSSLKDFKDELLIIGILPIICFWCIDAFYLKQERLYRNLYNHVLKQANIAPDSIIYYDLNAKNFESIYTNYYNCLFAVTNFPIYGLMFVCILGLITR